MAHKKKLIKIIGFVIALILVLMLGLLGYKLSYKKDVEKIGARNNGIPH